MEDGREYTTQERAGWVVNFLIRAGGAGSHFLCQLFSGNRGLDMAVGMGPVSFLTSGVLGIPGVALLYGIVLYQSL